jgi:hypothetical protein
MHFARRRGSGKLWIANHQSILVTIGLACLASTSFPSLPDLVNITLPIKCRWLKELEHRLVSENLDKPNIPSRCLRVEYEYWDSLEVITEEDGW